MFPNYWAARVALGRALVERGDIDEALKELEMAVAHIPENLLLHRLLASLYFHKEEWSKAVRYCQLVLFVNPQDRECLSIMEEISKIRAGESQAGPEEEKSLSPEKDGEEIITPTIAELYLSQGLVEKAVEIYRKLLIRQPDHEEWKERILSIQKERGLPAISGESGEEKGEVLEQLETWLKAVEEIELERTFNGRHI